MKLTAGIYKITNLVNLKCYIGKTERCIQERWSTHKRLLIRGKHLNSYLQAAWDKHGEANFSFEVIEDFNPEFNFDINALERFWIEDYKSNDREFGYNLTAGGEGSAGRKLSERHKAKIRSANLGNKHNLGRKLSEAHKAKISATNLGYNHTEEAKTKLSALNKGNKNWLGRKHSEESKAKMSAASLGRKFSEETRAKIGAATKKRHEESKAKSA